ncbi:hypothetical protein P3X46_004494 [Hevea brasiliensis]|uniref:Bifunctional inhibitor/plant lipid transfer protein/seed storage helical domain-containing protein n=1 Tax=Hevea brasiliensis TaxID=3981 RepID=A0ABQ9MZT4_HEVBR|nr:hypothetical protein P3X46_004494 [Hevea brasiliensis]
MASCKSNVIVLWMVAMPLTMTTMEGIKVVAVCNTDMKEINNQCYSAVAGNPPSPPSVQCCNLIQQADLPCLCKYKYSLYTLGVDVKKAMEIPGKCGKQNPCY